MEAVVPAAHYTFDASAKTITCSVPYNVITEEQVLKIRNLTVNEDIYNSAGGTPSISVATGVITYVADNSRHSDTDKFQILISSIGIDGGGA